MCVLLTTCIIAGYAAACKYCTLIQVNVFSILLLFCGHYLLSPWAKHWHTSLQCSQAASTVYCLQQKLEGMGVVLREKNGQTVLYHSLQAMVHTCY